MIISWLLTGALKCQRVRRGYREVAMNRHPESVLPRSFLRMCRRNLWRAKVADSSGAELTGASLLTRTLILLRLLLGHVLDPDEQYVGVLLPPSVGAVVTNAALALAAALLSI